MTEGVKFGKNGEWVKAHQLQVQYHDITDAANLETWRGMSYQTVLAPPDDVTGKVIYPLRECAEGLNGRSASRHPGAAQHESATSRPGSVIAEGRCCCPPRLSVPIRSRNG